MFEHLTPYPAHGRAARPAPLRVLGRAPATRTAQRRLLPPGMVLRPMTIDDIAQTSRLHLQHLPQGLFPRLGPRFLRAWHTTFVTSPAACATVIEAWPTDSVSGRFGEPYVVAYVLVAIAPAAHRRDALRQHRWRLALYGTAGLLSHPALAWFFLQTRAGRYARGLSSGDRSTPRSLHGSAEETDRNPPAVVHALVTAASRRGLGLGAILLEHASAHAARLDATEMALVTDGVHPLHSAAPDQRRFRVRQGATGFYERLGWRRVAERERDRRWLVEFRKDTAPAARTERPRPVGDGA